MTTCEVANKRAFSRIRMLAAVGLVTALLGNGVSGSAAEKASHPKATDAQRAMALNAVQNLIGRYEFYHFANMYDDPRYLNLFANGDPDTKVQMSAGIWQGPDAAKRLLKFYGIGIGGDGFVGQMHIHPISTPVLEVAGDGRTARGVWMSDGIEAVIRDGSPKGTNIWLKYCVDFKMVNGEWKIWHLNTYPVFWQVYDQPWQSGEPNMLGGKLAAPGGKAAPVIPPEAEAFKPDRPNNNLAKAMYKPSTVQTLQPVPPTPYDTWDDSMSCVE